MRFSPVRRLSANSAKRRADQKLAGIAVSDNAAIQNHLPDIDGISEQCDILQRIALHDNEIGRFAVFQRTGLFVQFQQAGTVEGGDADGFKRRQPISIR